MDWVKMLISGCIGGLIVLVMAGGFYKSELQNSIDVISPPDTVVVEENHTEMLAIRRALITGRPSGDINRDGELTIMDVITILDLYIPVYNGDFNNNGLIDRADVDSLIQKIYMKEEMSDG